ncbi:MAG TPA: DUF4124 domain-containing protein [Gammaproteobacteria bacterium]
MCKWLIVLSLFLTGANAATVWTWVDESGQVHYSDTPAPGARQIEIRDSARITTVPAPTPAAQPSGAPSRAGDSGETLPSRRVRVVRPAEQETLWNIGTMLEVEVEVTPPLEGDQRIDVMLDGRRLNLNTASTQFVVPDVFRGMHTLQAVLLDGGVEVFRSEPVTFMVQQTSVLNPNNPNARRR